jgi:hypothetical protein
MVIFEFRDPTPIEAFVLASEYERAAEMFRLHLSAHGGDPDTLLYRQWPLDDLSEPEQSHVREALSLDREGLLTWDLEGRWVFVTPLGAYREAE